MTSCIKVIIYDHCQKLNILNEEQNFNRLNVISSRSLFVGHSYHQTPDHRNLPETNKK
jgi:hypothetical protein